MTTYINKFNSIKLITLLSLSLIFIPVDKFSLPYLVLIFLDLTDSFYNFLCVLGFILFFNKSKFISLCGYLLASSLLPVFLFYKMGNLDIWFWLPLIVYFLSSIYLIYQYFKKINNEK